MYPQRTLLLLIIWQCSLWLTASAAHLSVTRLLHRNRLAFASVTRSGDARSGISYASAGPSSISRFTRRCNLQQLGMSLIPIPINELQKIVPNASRLTPTGDQYVTYLGRTPRERFNSLFEGFSVAFLGSMFAYFISFVIGQFLATLLGIIFVFWPILSPEFKAYQRNWELVGGRDLVDVWIDDEDDDYWSGIPDDKRGLYGAYYTAKLDDVCVVDDVRATSDEEYDLDEFSDYTMTTDELESMTGIPWKLRLRLLDDEGRGMQVHARMSEDYLDLEQGMSVVGVLLSTNKQFDKLAGMTDFLVLDEIDGSAVAWVGDYPYLAKDEFLRIIENNGVAEELLQEEDYFDEEDEDYDEDEVQEKKEELVPIKSKRARDSDR
jgi:hypothetical protein